LKSGNYITVITVEPMPDFDPAPFDIKILKYEMSATDPVDTNLPMSVITGNTPQVSVILN